MDYDEFYTWIAYSMMEPFGDDRADWRTAMQMAQVANMNRPKGRAPYKVKDFLLRFEDATRPEASLQQMEMALYARYLAWGGKPKDG